MEVVYYYGGELYHHGIQGQKWGVRRYQNPDGTLTEEGKKRYGTSSDKLSKERAEQLKDRSRIGNIIGKTYSGLRVGTGAAYVAAGAATLAQYGYGAATIGSFLSGGVLGLGANYLISKGVRRIVSNIARTNRYDKQVYENTINDTFADEPKSFYKNQVKPVYKEDMKKARKLISEGNTLINLGEEDKGIETAGVGYTIQNNAKRYKALGKNAVKGKNDEYYRKEAEKYGFDKNGEGYKIFKEADLGNVYAKSLIKDAKKDEDQLKKLIKSVDEKT